MLRKNITPLLDLTSKYAKTDVRYLLKGNFWLLFGRGIAILSGLALTYVFANYVSKETFGTYKYILSIVGIITGFALSGIGSAITTAVAQGKKGVVRSLFGVSNRWALMGSAISTVLAGYYILNDNFTLGIPLLFLAVFHPLNTSFGLSKSYLQGKGDFQGLAQYGGIRSLMVVIAVITTIFLSRGNVIWIIGSYFGASILTGIWMYYAALKKHQELHSLASENDRTETLSYGKHMSVIGIFTQISSQLDQFLLWHFVGPAGVAAYSIAYTPVRELQSVNDNILPLALPKFAKKDFSDVKKGIPFRISQMFTLSVIAFILYVLVAPFIFGFLFPQYPEAILVSQALALLFLLQPKSLIGAMFMAHARKKEQYMSAITTTLVKAGLFIVLIPLYGIWGAVAAIIAADAINTILMWILLRRAY